MAYEYARVHMVPDAMYWVNQSRKEKLETFSGTIEEREKIVKEFIQGAQELLEVPVNFLEKCGGFEVYEDWLKHNQISGLKTLTKLQSERQFKEIGLNGI